MSATSDQVESVVAADFSGGLRFETVKAQHNGELDAVVKRKGMFGEFAPYDFEGEGKK